MKKEGFGGVGTIRISKTAREEDEEKSGTTIQRQRAKKEQNRGIDRCLSELKIRHTLQVPWGTEYAMVLEDNEVFQVAWKDQAMVLFMSTVSDGTKRIVRQRRRPAKTSTNARTSRMVFGDAVVKDLAIPDYIDMYNHFMNGVDIADQLRSYYNTQKSHWKSWKALWHFYWIPPSLMLIYKLLVHLLVHGQSIARLGRIGHSEFVLQINYSTNPNV